ncbi:MAG: hypothetical protein DDT19_03011 [Syntrophomonadaceae bacterium]|nr:hypothetical protein [Bacillota bacterium]
MSAVAPSPAITTTSLILSGNLSRSAVFSPAATAFWLPKSECILWSASCEKAKLLQPVEPTNIESSGFGRAPTKVRKAKARLHPAHRGCSSKSSLNVPRSFSDFSFPKGPFLTRSIYSRGITSSKFGFILVISSDIFPPKNLDTYRCFVFYYFNYYIGRHSHPAIDPRARHYAVVVWNC